MNGSYPTRTCVEVELPPGINICVSLIAHRNLTKSLNIRVESRSTWACCIVGPYSQAARYNADESPSNLFYSGLIGLRSFEHLLGCGSKEQKELATSHRNQLTNQLTQGITPEPTIEQYGFVASEEFSTDSTFDLVVPCLPRGALLELVPHGFFDSSKKGIQKVGKIV